MRLIARLERLERRRVSHEPPEFNWSTEYEARFEEIHRLAFEKYPAIADMEDLDERAIAIARFCDEIYDESNALPAENPDIAGVGIGDSC